MVTALSVSTICHNQNLNTFKNAYLMLTAHINEVQCALSYMHVVRTDLTLPLLTLYTHTIPSLFYSIFYF